MQINGNHIQISLSLHFVHKKSIWQIFTSEIWIGQENALWYAANQISFIVEVELINRFQSNSRDTQQGKPIISIVFKISNFIAKIILQRNVNPENLIQCIQWNRKLELNRHTHNPLIILWNWNIKIGQRWMHKLIPNIFH